MRSGDLFRVVIQMIVLFALQVMVLNNVSLFGFATPMIYPLVLLTLPIRLPIAVLLLISFAYGLLIDSFSDTGGIHAAALTMMTFARTYILQRLEPQAGYAKDASTTDAKLGFTWFVTFVVMSLLVHHYTYYILEALSFRLILTVVLKSILSVILSVVIILIWRLLFMTTD